MDVDVQERIDLLRKAQYHLFQAIRILETAVGNDPNAKAYLIDRLKSIATSEGHGFLSSDINIDQLIERVVMREKEVNPK